MGGPEQDSAAVKKHHISLRYFLALSLRVFCLGTPVINAIE